MWMSTSGERLDIVGADGSYFFVSTANNKSGMAVDFSKRLDDMENLGLSVLRDELVVCILSYSRFLLLESDFTSRFILFVNCG